MFRQYRCNNCGEVEVWQSIKDDLLTECPKCKSKDFYKLYFSPKLKFIGSGFYVNDYQKADKNKKLRRGVKEKFKDKYEEKIKPEVKLEEED